MAKVKLTKTELKRQRDQLKQFTRFLPTLQLKKQQLQTEVRRVSEELNVHEHDEKQFAATLRNWVQLFSADEAERLGELSALGEVQTETQNIAGIDVPVFVDADFERDSYDLFTTPSWFEAALDAAEQQVRLSLKGDFLRRQMELLQEELRTTTQRVNLFEKVKIPEAKENIRRIQVYLGDQQTAAVGRSKIAKNKIEASDKLGVSA